MSKEAKARIKINKLLEEAGWRFFDDEKGPANILLENYVKITEREIDAWGITASGNGGFTFFKPSKIQSLFERFDTGIIFNCLIRWIFQEITDGSHPFIDALIEIVKSFVIIAEAHP